MIQAFTMIPVFLADLPSLIALDFPIVAEIMKMLIGKPALHKPSLL
jgi:hypothetical protein